MAVPARLFLQRQTYRYRRLVDALRVLPVLGFVLWMLPLLLAGEPQRGMASSANSLIFIFGVWCLLIVFAAWLAHRLGRHADPTSSTSPQLGQSGDRASSSQ